MHSDNPDYASDFRSKATLGVAVAALFLLTPFSVNNFIQGRYVLGAGSLAIVAILAANAWSIRRMRDYSALTLLALVPAVLFFLILSLRSQGIVGALWCYPAVISFYFMLPERKAWVANAVLLAVTIPQAWVVLETPLAARVVATLLAVSVFSAIFVRVIIDQQVRLQALASTDSLTGLSNRTLLRATLEQATRVQPSYALAHENLGDVLLRLARREYDLAARSATTTATASRKLELIDELIRRTTPDPEPPAGQ